MDTDLQNMAVIAACGLVGLLAWGFVKWVKTAEANGRAATRRAEERHAVAQRLLRLECWRTRLEIERSLRCRA